MKRLDRKGLARLNHILIPATKGERDRWRRGRTGKVVSVALTGYLSLTEEGRFLSVAWLLVASLGVEVRANQVHLIWCLLTGVFVASVLLRRFYKLDARLDLEVPERVTVDEPLEIGVVIENRSARDALAIRVQRPLLPFDGRWTGAPSVVRKIEPGETRRAATSAAFATRGVHHLDPFYAGCIVPLGVTVGPSLESPAARFVVVPRIAPVARLRVEMATRYQPGGVALASQIGESRELMGLRPYRPGDRVRDLSARGWGRVGYPVVREYQEEYFTRVGVVLDTDGLDGDERGLEAAISLAAGVVAHFTRGEALIDLLVVGDKLHRLTLGRSLGFLEQALDLLAAVEPSAGFDQERVSSILTPHLSRLSCVVFVARVEDEGRRALVRRVRSTGTGCRALVVGESLGGFAAVPLERIERREELHL
ncbi:MAG: DUF58 domain-containing protein [Deltaproteobacteria bacterium]|nr:DUF58 domain-containing protein [Deltaproteobacteria bacterium]